jgi:hypothetical protein
MRIKVDMKVPHVSLLRSDPLVVTMIVKVTVAHRELRYGIFVCANLVVVEVNEHDLRP